MVKYGYEHPDSEGSIYVRKNRSYKYRDGNTGERGKTKAEVRIKNKKHYRTGPQNISGVAEVRGKSVSFPGINQSYVLVKKKRRR